jgi:RNA polymerase II C-terminal domain phosphatase-like 3/4
MQRYYYFVHSARQLSSDFKSVTESNMDESEYDGILASILIVLRRAHELFFDPVRLIAYLLPNL